MTFQDESVENTPDISMSEPADEQAVMMSVADTHSEAGASGAESDAESQDATTVTVAAEAEPATEAAAEPETDGAAAPDGAESSE